MRLFSKIRDRGISMRFLNYIIIGIAIVLSVLLYLVITKTNSIYQETHEITQDLIRIREDSDDVIEASDYLTEQIRSFAVTGERVYLDNYFKEVKETKWRDNALEKLKSLSEDTTAVQELENAINDSRTLEEQEYYSARMTIEGYGYDVSTFDETIRKYELKEEDQKLTAEEKKTKAIGLLFNNEYQGKKETIHAHTGCWRM